MAKGAKKKNRKLRRQIRKTIGALLMVSAITVAAIPVPDVRADPADPDSPAASTVVLDDKVWIWDTDMGATTKPADAYAGFCESTIPTVAAGETIYSSGDGKFQFAYVNPSTGGGSKVAVILNYVQDNLPGGTLEIKDTMEAFRKYRATSTDGYYCLVTQNDEFMFYDVYEQDTAVVNGTDQPLYWVNELKYVKVGDGQGGRYPETSDDKLIGTSYVVNFLELNGEGKYVTSWTEKDENGNPVTKTQTYEVTPRMVTHQKPCYYEQRDIEGGWGDRDDTELYYQDLSKATDDNPNGLFHPSSQEHYRIDARVAYIGKQFIDNVEDDKGIVTGWKIRTDGSNNLVYRTNPEDGVFAASRGGNIANLIIGQSLSGISDYAFYGTSIQSIVFGNNLTTIGNGAFMDCIRLNSVTMPEENNIKSLGKEAFKGCTSLPSIKVPISVLAIGDSCFEGCTSLAKIELWGGDFESEPQTSWLQVIGNYAFKNCSKLGSLFLPEQYSESDLQIAVFEGCTNLQVVRVPNEAANFAETKGGYTFENFKGTVPGSFYFWGADTRSDDRNFRSALHKTANDNEIAYKYWDRELYEIVKSEGTGDNAPKITYQVNNKNELEKIWVDGEPVNVVIPSQIGPYGISIIATGCFDNACTLKRVTIPKSVITIADGAFKGSHNLQTIIFEDTTTVKEIGKDAFRTQEATCAHKDTIDTQEPTLTIVGAMMDAENKDTVPFAYAMQRDNMINNEKQVESWITCHSGWPTNLEVKYNYDFTTNQGGSELQSYPRYSNFLKESDTGAIIADEDAIENYVNSLPYVNTSEETKAETLVAVIKAAIEKYEGNNPSDPPTEMQAQIVNASKNVVVPTNVNRLKPGIFSGYTYKTDADGNVIPASVSLEKPDVYLNSVILNGVNTVDPFTFTGCNNLKNVSIIGATKLGDYAFGAVEAEDPPGTIKITEACDSLTNVTLGANITETGLRPFRGCANLTTIECLGENLSYNNGLLFNQTEGNKVLVQCLPGRGDNVGSVTVRAEELAGVTALQEEAFMECNTIRNVDLSSSKIREIPRSAFENADQLSVVVIGDTVGSIENDAFVNDPLLNEITIPSSVTYIANGAFISKPKQQKIEFTCKEDTAADRYAKAKENSSYITPNYNIKEYFYAQFIDYPDYPDISREVDFPDSESSRVQVPLGEVAPTPATTPAPRNGFVFKGWQNNRTSNKPNDEIVVIPQFGATTHTVTFVDGCRVNSVGIIAVQSIENGRNPDSKSLELPDHTGDGYVFDGFTPTLEQIALDGGVTSDMTIVASYVSSTAGEKAHTVTYYDFEGKVYTTQTVGHGEAAAPVTGPTRVGYTFVRWAASGDLSKVEKDIVATPVYDISGGNNPGGSPSPGRPGASGSPNPSGSASPSSSASPSASPEVTKYTVSVSGGSGSGRYAAGEIVAINAYYMGEGQAFDRWTSSTAGVGFSNPNATSATFTMPAANVAITATYKTGSGTPAANTGGGTGTGGGGTGSGGTTSNNGTTVEVTKPGISNTNYAGATVSGATDNFIVKVTEDQEATNAVIAALQARYGDISRIKYLPMDISLYDSTGRTRIADTTGITVNLTLPIPDDLVQYAGNNKVAAVANGALEDLNVRFTTVGGVPCVNFTATHFSPYVIYVDTANLTEATIDTTPKTGDPIHPKWFLALGMACVSLILFFKRDKVVVRSKTKTA